MCAWIQCNVCVYLKHPRGFNSPCHRAVHEDSHKHNRNPLPTISQAYLFHSKTSTLEKKKEAGAEGGRKIKVSSWLREHEVERVREDVAESVGQEKSREKGSVEEKGRVAE